MRIAVISDVHANLEALQAVVRDIDKVKVDKIVFLGDAIGYGADPDKCVKIINNACEIKLLGNHDFVGMGLASPRYFNPVAKESIQWTQNTLKEKTITIMSNFELEATLLDYYFVHASPDDPSEWSYILTVNDAETNFKCFSQSFCFVGHSHQPIVFSQSPEGDVVIEEGVPFTAQPGYRYIINVGSIGQPRDGDPNACYLIADTDSNHFEHKRVAYDLEKAQKKMKKASLPESLITRLANGK